ncbi:MAG: tRNA (adenosine(37)-N6)-threonylcarbamoyltransferase complex transferase subunit TsaD [Candidatus Aminicenantes bacterium]|nr:MAG: tRNA (adenosine(37)-N6)-threonylcarbamoyltransferase complex transferase subunit TsaD [Candidatus Aminicenantes bacterium]
MLILGIETSCDETSAAVLDDKLEILSNVVLSQDEIHASYGGVVPELASRQHIVSIGYVVDEGLRRAKLTVQDLDAYAVTQGPGLIGSLLIGLSFAKGLAFYFDKPLVPVDHLEAHIHSAFLENRKIPFPCLALLVSGGHTSLFFLKEKFHYQLIGKTRDDAAGEALDKIAKYLDLGYPGGPLIDKMAEKGDPRTFSFSLPHMTDQSMDFSFSGLKTAALRTIKQNRITKSHPSFLDLLASFENAVIGALLYNVRRTIKIFKPSALILCGGVARNKKLRRDFARLAQKTGLPSFIPSPELCTDNAAMVAALAVEKINTGEELTLSLDLNAYPRT